MAYAHVAHDCHVGNHTIFGNAATLGGHVTVEDYATISAFSGVHQFCRVGQHAFIGGFSVVTKDALPYRQDGRQPRAHLRPEHHRPRAPRVLAGCRRQAAPRLPLPAALEHQPRASRRSSAIRRCKCDEVQHLVEFIRTSSRGVGLRRPSRRLEEVVEE